MLPGNLQAFKDTPIYARTNGYLKRWYTDIGTRVKAGQLLAEIETPEIDDQLKQARADRATAEANYELAKVTATRWQELLKTDAVAKQATDQTVSDFHAREAMLQSARFNESPAGEARVVREGVRAVRRCHHRAQHRHRRADQRRQHRRAGHGAVPHGRHAAAARLCVRSAGLRAGSAAWTSPAT